ncbi:hypothetical protein BH10PSE17_BH10PSE17_36760 [soil metagenome]
MELITPPSRSKSYLEICFGAPFVFQLLGVLLWNTAIAALLVLGFGNDEPFRTWVYSNLIGCIIWFEHIGLMQLAHRSRREIPGWVHAALTVVTVPVGLIGGNLLGNLLWSYPTTSMPNILTDRTSLSFTLLVTLLGVMFFWSRARAADHKAEAAARSEALEAQERRATEAHLKLLQTQLEPHFLFNTLGVLDSMIATEPDRARELLQSLNRYLRAALMATRATADGHTLGNELVLIESYLQIMQMRFGDRLGYELDVDDAARAVPFPTMLLQPLVENAIRHGVEPSKTGGVVRVEARCSDDAGRQRLVIRVSDTGVGLSDQPTTRGTGAGLANIRERLAALYGADARIVLEDNRPRGVVAQLSLPCAPCR